MQRHRIDDHLGRYASALRHITQAGDEHFDEALEYARQHRLFELALRAYEDDADKYQVRRSPPNVASQVEKLY